MGCRVCVNIKDPVPLHIMHCEWGGWSVTWVQYKVVIFHQSLNSFFSILRKRSQIVRTFLLFCSHSDTWRDNAKKTLTSTPSCRTWSPVDWKHSAGPNVLAFPLLLQILDTSPSNTSCECDHSSCCILYFRDPAHVLPLVLMIDVCEGKC